MTGYSKGLDVNTGPSDALAPSVPAALDERSRHLRRLAIQALAGGERGHVGSTMSLIEILRVLFDDVLRYRPAEPQWSGRDRFILSKGHGCLALYALLADKGFFPVDELSQFCRHDTYLGGHPEAFKVPGVEASTGALGHGLSLGVGMALGLRLKASQAHVFVVMGDGEINEGSVWEAAMSASKHGLDRLTAVIDYNKIQSFGPVSEVLPLEPLADKWRSFGFAVCEVDGHSIAALRQALALPSAPAGKPRAVIAHTIKGRGIAFAENVPAWHHKSKFTPKQIADLYAALETG
jgi:transketolase